MWSIMISSPYIFYTDDIKVKFRDSKGWEEDGVFQGTDVHYQVCKLQNL